MPDPKRLIKRIAQRVGDHVPASVGLLPKRRIQTGLAEGLWISSGPSNTHYAIGDNELPVQHAISDALKPGDVFYDVGANVGFFTLIAARKVGGAGAVYAFEPVPANARLAASNARRNGLANVRVMQLAIAERSGEGRLTEAVHAGGATLSTTTPPPDARRTITVPQVSVDDLVFREALPRPDVVKVDVEGTEIAVLDGMARTLAEHAPTVIFEVDDGDRAALEAKYDACCATLGQAGYRVDRLDEAYGEIGWHVAHGVAVRGE